MSNASVSHALINCEIHENSHDFLKLQKNLKNIVDLNKKRNKRKKNFPLVYTIHILREVYSLKDVSTIFYHDKPSKYYNN